MLMLGRLALVLTGPATGEEAFKLGSMWRGALAPILHQSVCSQAPNSPCANCSQVHACAYGSLYESQAPPGFQQLASSGVPAPIALYVSQHTVKQNVLTIVEYSLLSHAILLLPALVQAALRLIARAQGLGPQRSRLQLAQLIWEPRAGDSDSRQILNPNAPLYFTPVQAPNIPPAPKQVNLRSLVPLRINHRGQAINTMTPQDFLRRLLRRMRLICRIYHYPAPPAELIALIEHVAPIASDWQPITQSRRSSRQQRNVPVGGLHGWMRFELPTQARALWPWLWLGQFLHVGQGSTQGFGRFLVEGGEAESHQDL
jgi:CRISPR/Cas system endoribonuclease Cas6 (RAMP superfamily)